MPAVNLRNISRETLTRLAAEAARRGMSREALIRRILEDYARQIGLPQALVCYTDTGVRAQILRLGDGRVMTVYENGDWTPRQLEAIDKAGLLVQPQNGSRWAEARQCLEEAGFTVLVQ
jgi:plasmid stability protein